ncbi:MAG: gliding motility-associated protein GldE [Paludibacteraceae bacterium]|nr:gliding motility-associated protein GldE [Paludibacteraceae bacterium]
MSMSETAFFSLTPTQIDELQKSDTKRDRMVLDLLKKPQRLLATILIGNNFVNIIITLLFAYATAAAIPDHIAPVWVFLIETVLITFLLLLFGEITPKVYASVEPVKMAKLTAGGIRILSKVFAPLSFLLVKSTSIVERRMEKYSHSNLSMDELSQAVELTDIATEEEKGILEGITKFGNRCVSDVMHSRLDIVDVDIKANFKQLLSVIISSGYSRIPVIAGTSDTIKGVVYSKDLLPHLDKPQNFRWQTLIRPAYFVPESKHLDDLLQEFQQNKIHLAIVVDEYGGTSGLITLEDILEEIVGEISDEYDDEEKQYTRLNENTYLFEGKILLNDFYKVLDIPETEFERVAGEAETLAGLVLELKGDFPKRGETVKYGKYEFEVVALDKRRIKTIKLIVKS